MKKVLFFALGTILVLLALFLIFKSKNGNERMSKVVPVKKGSIAEKALAVGTIEPEKEIFVKSSIPGIIGEVFFKIGDQVKQGEPLFNISPNPTPLEYAEALRNMEIAEVTLNRSNQEKQRMLKLYKEQMISSSDMENFETHYNEAVLKYRINQERFKLLEKGRIQLSEKSIDSIVKSPITGVVLSQNVYVGDAVVPLTNFQPGTELCAMADMGKMLFKGTVDEIDVGKLVPGMAAEINVGALPGTRVAGRLMRISPKARKQGNATLFDIEVSIGSVSGQPLRAGYSATAYVKIQEKNGVPVIPERLVTFEEGKRFVEIKEGNNIRKVEIQTGLSDGLNIEVKGGLELDQQVVERPPREIT